MQSAISAQPSKLKLLTLDLLSLFSFPELECGHGEDSKEGEDTQWKKSGCLNDLLKPELPTRHCNVSFRSLGATSNMPQLTQRDKGNFMKNR